jgi:hypothetical protein
MDCRLSNLFIPGFPKSGTTSLFNMLTQHPLISGSTYKEPHTYSIDSYYQQRFDPDHKRALPALYAHEKPRSRFRLDASTTYLISPVAISRIIDDCPDSLFIVPMRDPVERVISHYHWLAAQGQVRKPFRKEIAAWHDRPFLANEPIDGCYKYYTGFSAYGTQLQRLLSVVGKDRVFFFACEDLAIDPVSTVNRIFDFLNIVQVSVETTFSNITEEDFQGTSIPWHHPLRRWRVFRARKNYISGADVTTEDKAWCYQLIESEIRLLENMGLLFPSWKTVRTMLPR